jgi:ABC-2 type transport system permease protein
VPVLLYVAVGLVVVIPLGIRAFLPDAEVLEYWEYFTIIFSILGVFVATIAPEMLCNDRRENVLNLYFSRAITRADYLLAKLLGTALLTLTITLIPMIFYWLGRQLLEDSPLSAMKDNSGDLWRVIVMSVITAFYLGSVGLMISSFTGRKSIAVAVIIVGFLVVTAFAGILTEVVSDADVLPYIALLSPADTITFFSWGLFDQPPEELAFGEPLSVWVYGAVMLAVVAMCCGVMYWRYVPSD